MRNAWPAFFVVFSCATPQALRPVAEPTQVVATYGERQIRLQEVDAKVANELASLQERIFELRAQTAEGLAMEAIIAAKAREAGLSEDEWISRELGNDGSDDNDASVRKARALFARLKRESNYRLLLPAPEKLRRAVSTSGPSRGVSDAKVVIVEFADFECGYCARAHRTLEKVLKAYEGQVRLVFRHYPLSFHPKAPQAAAAAVCASEQGKFWEFHDSLFESGELDDEALEIQAVRVGMSAAPYRTCLASPRADEEVKRDLAEGARLGVRGTPAFFVNGISLTGAQPEEAFRKLIDAELQR